MINKPKIGDLILFQIDGVWIAAIHPILPQILYDNDYDTIKQKALEYAADWPNRDIQVWKEIDANTEEYLLES